MRKITDTSMGVTFASHPCVDVGSWTSLQIAASELRTLPSISASDAVLLQLACSHTADLASSLSDSALPFSTALLDGVSLVIFPIAYGVSLKYCFAI